MGRHFLIFIDLGVPQFGSTLFWTSETFDIPSPFKTLVSPLRIYYAMLPMAECYLEYLEAVKTIETNRQLLAGWSNRSWCMEVAKVLATLRDPESLSRLGLVGDHVSDGDGEEEDARLFFQLVVATASHRCWSMSMHSELPPDSWFGILDQDSHASAMAFTKLRTSCTLIKRVKDFLSDLAERRLSTKAKEAGYQSMGLSGFALTCHTFEAHTQICPDTFLLLT